MKVNTLDNAVDLSTAGNSSPFVLTGFDYPFEPGNSAVIALGIGQLGAGDAVMSVEGREDAVSSFTTLQDINGVDVDIAALGGAPEFFEVILPQELRITVVETTGVGLGSVNLLQN